MPFTDFDHGSLLLAHDALLKAAEEANDSEQRGDSVYLEGLAQLISSKYPGLKEAPVNSACRAAHQIYGANLDDYMCDA